MAITFEDWLYAKGLHKHTIEKHTQKIKLIEKELSGWDVGAILTFVSTLKRKGTRNTTVNGYLGTLRQYILYKGLDVDLKQIKLLPKQAVNKGVLTDDEIERLINLPCPDNAERDIWNKFSLYLSCLAYTGARPMEIANLRKRNVDLGRSAFVLEITKTGVPRQLEIAPCLIEPLRGHLDSVEDYLFTTKRGQLFSDHSWIPAFNKRVKMLGIHRSKVSIYSLRHSFCTRLLEEDVNLHKVAKIMGHSIEMTQQYEHLTFEDVRRGMRKLPLIRRQVKYSKEELITIMTQFANDLGVRYEIDTDGNRIRLEAVI